MDIFKRMFRNTRKDKEIAELNARVKTLEEEKHILIMEPNGLDDAAIRYRYEQFLLLHNVIWQGDTFTIKEK